MAGSKQADTALDLLFDTQLLPRRISYPDMAINNDPCACTYDISDETFGILSACSHSTCTMHMPALSTAIMNHCMLLRTNRQDAARSKPSITHELLPIKDKMLPRRPPAKESAAEGLPEDIAHMEPHLQGQCIAIITQVHASTLMKLSAAEQCKRRV